jgi:sodium/hydrogen antiporter
MILGLAFALTLLVSVLLSELARRTVLSASVIFLCAGFIIGRGGFGLVNLSATQPLVSRLADLALFAVLFTDGMRLGVKDLTSAWRLPGRALLLGLPLTLAGTAAIAHYLAGLPWLDSFLVGAILSPTDPVFAEAIVGREEIPFRLRHLLNVESGLNDGLALPIVLAIMAHLGTEEAKVWAHLWELALGVLIGTAVPWITLALEKSRFFSVTARYQPLFAFSIGLLVFTSTSLLHANEYLAAYASGITIANVNPSLRNEFNRFGELISELLKLSALLTFGALISRDLFSNLQTGEFLFAIAALVVVRPAALALALFGTELKWPEKVAAYWFGPKGFASVVYGLILLKSGIPQAGHLFHVIALTVSLSIVAHSSTDVIVAKWFHKEDPSIK